MRPLHCSRSWSGAMFALRAQRAITPNYTYRATGSFSMMVSSRALDGHVAAMNMACRMANVPLGLHKDDTSCFRPMGLYPSFARPIYLPTVRTSRVRTLSHSNVEGVNSVNGSCARVATCPTPGHAWASFERGPQVYLSQSGFSRADALWIHQDCGVFPSWFHQRFSNASSCPWTGRAQHWQSGCPGLLC
ncbi:hypothetical protein VTG60DRAFT_4113 [Thermothelomyces hinnuleus]